MRRVKQLQSPSGQILRYCPDCEVYLPVGKFNVCNRDKNGLSIYCSKHAAERKKESKAKAQND